MQFVAYSVNQRWNCLSFVCNI